MPCNETEIVLKKKVVRYAVKRLAVKARGAPGRRGRVSTAIGRSPRPLAWATVVDPKRNGFKCKPAT